MPKLSILLPTYNGAPFLAEQLDSILAQTDGDFELLAIDDGSSDGTISVLDDFAARDPRIVRLPASGNAGQNARLVELLGHAQSEFVAIADQDDRWGPDRNTILLQSLGNRQLAYGRSELTDKAGNLIGKSLLDVLYGDRQSSEPLLSLIQPMFSAHAMIIRRASIGADAFARVIQFDWLLGLEAVFGDGIVYCDNAVVYHRLHDSNQCNVFSAETRRLNRSSLRASFLFRMPERLRLIAVFDYLGRSPRVGPQWRRAFLKLAQDCQTIWFSEWRALRSHASLREQIISTLAPWAGSPEDLDRFSKHIDVLTRPGVSGAVLGEIGRRLRDARRAPL